MKRFVLIALVIALGMFGASFCMAENAGQDTTYAISINENEYGRASVCTNAESRSFSSSGGSASAGAKVWLKARLWDWIELDYEGKYTFKTWNVTYRETQDAAPKPVNVYYDYGFKNKNPEEIGAWCFIMPAGDVTVSPVFAEAAVLNVLHGYSEVFVNGKSIEKGMDEDFFRLPVGEEITLMIGTGSDLGSRISDVRVNGKSLTNLKPWEMFVTYVEKVKEFEGNGPYCQVSFIMPEGEADVEVTKTSVSADDYTPLLSEDEDGLGEDTQFKKHWCYSYTPKKSGYYTFTYAEYSILWVYDVSIGNTMGNGPYKMIAGHTYYLYALNDFENEADRICTMKVERTALLTPHTVTVDSNIQHGAIAASPIPFYEGEKVGLTITPDAGYILDTLTVSVGETPLETSWLSRTVYGFIAPLEDSFPEDDSSVRITATFKQIEPISYTGGSLGTNYLPVTTATKELRSGWYAVTEDVTMNERMIVTGDVNLLLCDGKTLNAACGIGVARGNSLTIWTQNGGTGALRAIAERSINHVGAGIGGYNDLTSGNTDTWYGGSITIHGGTITADANGNGFPGIGGTEGTVTIHGGRITATGNPGIGGTEADVTITGGTVRAESNSSCAGIGGGSYASAGKIRISGGDVTAIGYGDGAGIGGGGWKGSGGSITISGGTVTATGGYRGAGIGGGDHGSGGIITISGGTVNASGGTFSTGIGGGYEGSGQDYVPTGAQISLSWTKETDSISATGYHGTVSLSRHFKDANGGLYQAENEYTDPSVFAGKTLIPTVLDIAGTTVEVGGSYVYDGSAQTPAASDVSVTLNGIKLKDTADYTFVAENNTEAGTATVTVTGTWNYKGTASAAFTIAPKPVTITGLSAESKTYDGTTAATVTGTATLNGVLDADKANVSVVAGGAAFSDANAGKDKTVTFTGFSLTGAAAGNYALSAQPANVTADITPKPISSATVTLDKTQLTYNGGEQTVSVTGVVIDGLTLTADDYTVSGNTGTDKGDYTLTVTGVGNFKEAATAAWQIVEKAMTVSAENVTVPYDGQPHGIAVTVTDPESGAAVKYGAAEGTYDLDTSPALTDAGTLTVYYKVTAANYTDYTGLATVTICKVDSAVTTAPVAKTGLVYIGSAQELVTAGEAEGGTMVYALGENAITAPADNLYTTTIPTATDAGTYYVWYKVVGDANHLDTEAACITASIVTPEFGDPDFAMPGSLTVIEESAFEGVTSVKVVDAHTCTAIAQGAFKGTGLEKIRLPKECKISPAAFDQDGLIYVYAPSGGTTQAYCGEHDNLVFVAE